MSSLNARRDGVVHEEPDGEAPEHLGTPVDAEQIGTLIPASSPRGACQGRDPGRAIGGNLRRPSDSPHRRRAPSTAPRAAGHEQVHVHLARYSSAIGCTVGGSPVSTAAFSFGRSAMSAPPP